jgi:hypothetical protein
MKNKKMEKKTISNFEENFRRGDYYKLS